MREWLRGLLGRTKLDRLELMQRELVGLARTLDLRSQRQAERSEELAAHHEALGQGIAEVRQQLLHTNQRLDALAAQLQEAPALRQRLEHEAARVRSLGEQTGHLLNVLADERRKLQQAEARGAAADTARVAADLLRDQLRTVSAERDALRAARPPGPAAP